MEEETEYGDGGKAIADNVSIGDNIVVPCESDNGEGFWLLLCDKPKHVVKDTFTDAYKNTYYEGDEVIGGCYYDLFQPRSRTYMLNDESQLAYIYSHLVCASNFALPPTTHNIRGSYLTFELLVDIFQLIEKALEDLRLLDGDLAS